MHRRYEKLAPFDLGYGGHETGVFVVAAGKFPKKPTVSLVPLDGLLDYYADLDVLASRLEEAGARLVRRYNSRKVRTALEWRDEVCRYNFAGRNGREETTIFELRLTTYGFHVGGSPRPIEAGDLRVADTSASRPRR
jgi:hypothetical protein